MFGAFWFFDKVCCDGIVELAQAGDASGFTFPNDEHLPSASLELASMASVTLLVSGNLLTPISLV